MTLLKNLFKTKEDFIDWLFEFETDDQELCFQIEKRNHLAPFLGVEFKGLMEITDKEEDDGEWAGKEHYHWNDIDINDTLPTSFPCVMVWSAEKYKYDIDYTVGFVYPVDFE